MLRDSVTKCMSAAEWLRSHSNELDSDVISAAQQLLSAVASSSGVERVFSNYGIVHSKLKNQLGTKCSKTGDFVQNHDCTQNGCI